MGVNENIIKECLDKLPLQMLFCIVLRVIFNMAKCPPIFNFKFEL